jgi:hypothetical protein
MDKVEEDKEPISFDDAKEVVIRKAIDLKFVKTRLQTHIQEHNPELTLPERHISDFFKNPILSDVTLVHPTSNAQYKVHRILVASGSRYLL